MIVSMKNMDQGITAGFPLPPMIIYAKSFPGGQYRFDGPGDAVYARVSRLDR